MHRLSRPSPAASRMRTSQRGGVAASRQSPAQRAEDRRASWVVRVLTVAAVVGGVLHFLDGFLEEPSPPAGRSPSSERTRSRSSERRRAALPLAVRVADDSTSVRTEQLDHDAWQAPDTPVGLADEPGAQDSEAFADARDPPGHDTGIVISPVAAVARFEKDEPQTEVALIEHPQSDIVAAEPDPNEAGQAYQHVDPAVDTGIVVTPIGYSASAK